MKILKQIFINSATAIITIAVIGSAYAAISTVSSGDPLTADSWNQIVNKFDGIGENSVKEYVDSTVSANSGGGWSNCEAKSNNSAYSVTLSCSAGKSIRSHSYMCSQGPETNGRCGITSMTTSQIILSGHYADYNGSSNDSYVSASIVCCDD